MIRVTLSQRTDIEPCPANQLYVGFRGEDGVEYSVAVMVESEFESLDKFAATLHDIADGLIAAEFRRLAARHEPVLLRVDGHIGVG